jgi:hypothetical protein|tara:strand:- start:1869 stop:3992 length:2124 start_codon:yes stop_codon:yes gene_type:complete
MADKTPVRVVFNESNVATGLAEFQSGETVPVANGGTGLSSIGSAGQILKVNAAGSGLEFGAEGDISITNLVAPTNADLTFSTSGTGNIVLDAITVRGTTFSAADSTKITIAEALDVTGALTFSGLTLPTSDGTVGQFLQTDGSGTLSFASVSVGDLDIVGSSIASPSNADLTLDPSGTGNIKLNADTDITGSATITTTTTDDSLLITSTEDSNSAAPVLTLKRNSSSPADADYLGRIKFKGENDADQEVQYGSISGKILDASDGTEDGAIEFNVKKAGSNNIAMRINSDEVKLLNSTTLDVDGAGTFAGSVTATSLTTNTIESNGSNADLSIQPSGTGDVLISALRINGTTLDSSDSSKITIAEALDVTGAFTASSLAYPTSDGSAGQFMTTDGAGTLSFADLSLGDLTIVGSTITTPSNADFVLDPSGSGKVNINGAYTLPSSDGTSGQVLQTNGSGTLSFADVSLGDFTFTGSTISSPSNADITLDPSGSGDIQLKANTVITGNLTVSGTQTTLETTTLVVEDPLLELAKNNSGGIANTFDQGLFFNRGSLANVSFLWDESADEFVAAVTSGEDGSTSGNVTIDSYANFRAGIVSTTGNVVLGEDATIIFEGASDNESETVLTVVDPTADRTISLPNKSGTLAMDTDLNFPVSTLAAHPAASGDADLGSNVTAAILDAFGVPTGDLYDMAEPRGSTSTVDLGAFS